MILWIEAIGWAAAGLTLAAYSMRTMLPLRMVAIGANVFFIAYGYLAEVYPTLGLHLALLPFNAYRLFEILRTRRDLKQVRAGQDPLVLLEPLLSIQTHPRNSHVFRKGDRVDHLYVLKSGTILLEDIGVELSAGDIFGEIGFFTDEKERTVSARCLTECEVAHVDEETFMKLHYQHPSFGLYIMKLGTRRLVDGIRRNPAAYVPLATSRSTRT
jgi:hypothetical protein